MIKLAMISTFSTLKQRAKFFPHAQLLKKKIFKENQINPVLKHLQQLKKHKRLQDHFANKPVTDLSMQEIYFYLTNAQSFVSANRVGYLALISNPAMDAYSCFVIAQSSPFLEDQQFQTKLIRNFNQGSPLMSAQQLVYCLRLLKKLDIGLLQKHLNLAAIQSRVNHPQQQVDFDYLQVLLQLNNLALFHLVANLESLKMNVQKLGLRVAKASAGIKQYYILNKIENVLGITHSKNIQNLREKQIEKKIILANTPEQLEYSIKIIQKYKQFIYQVKIQKMSPQLYIQFLKFLCDQTEKNSKFVVLSHLTPMKVIQQSKSEQFREIIKLRVNLKLQKQQQLGKMVKRIMTYDLESVMGLIIYLHRDSQIDEVKSPQAWIDFQEGFVKALHLNKSKKMDKMDISKIVKQQNVVQIFRIFGYMSRNNLGSSTFYKHSHLFIHDFLMNENLIKGIPPEDQNKFIIYSFNIYGIRTIPEHIEKKLINLTLVTLTNNDWPLYELYTLVRCLFNNRFGEDEVWYAIENKVMQINISKNSEQSMRLKLGYIFQFFKQMNLGSYKFKAKMTRLEEIGALIKPDFSLKPNEQKSQKEAFKKFQLLQHQKLQN